MECSCALPLDPLTRLPTGWVIVPHSPRPPAPGERSACAAPLPNPLPDTRRGASPPLPGPSLRVSCAQKESCTLNVLSLFSTELFPEKNEECNLTKTRRNTEMEIKIMKIETRSNSYDGFMIEADDSLFISQVMSDRICVQLVHDGKIYASAEKTPSPSFERTPVVMLCLLSRPDVRAEIPTETREFFSTHLVKKISPGVLVGPKPAVYR